MQQAQRPRRSILYMPGSNPRALAKGRSLPADGLILDLEDAVAVDAKEEGRRTIARTLEDRSAYGRRELVVRVNGLETKWGRADLTGMARAGADAILLPKVESAEQVDQAAGVLDGAGSAADLPIWCMIETPRGVLRVEEIADHPRVACLVMGTSDLTKDLRARHTADRAPMLPSLAFCLLAARAAGIDIVDGVHLDLDDAEGFARSCRQGRDLGFDGKTLIHPAQIGPANTVFGPSAGEIDLARRQIAAFAEAEAEGRGVAVLDGRIVENLHVETARATLALAEVIASRAAQ
ncbi:MAG: CoA ester lyase [Geminicoccaceae bacterium]|nr:CoA ester lyase [Geminicoccaceae bacterium]